MSIWSIVKVVLLVLDFVPNSKVYEGVILAQRWTSVTPLRIDFYALWQFWAPCKMPIWSILMIIWFVIISNSFGGIKLDYFKIHQIDMLKGAN